MAEVIRTSSEDIGNASLPYLHQLQTRLHDEGIKLRALTRLVNDTIAAKEAELLASAPPNPLGLAKIGTEK